MNAGAWGAFRIARILGADATADTLGHAFRYGDGFWKVTGAVAFLSLLAANLAALGDDERDPAFAEATTTSTSRPGPLRRALADVVIACSYNPHTS